MRVLPEAITRPQAELAETFAARASALTSALSQAQVTGGTMADMPKARVLKIGVVDADAERTRLRGELDRFEERYGLPSDRLAEAFTGPDGDLDESEDFHAWGKAWASYQILTGR